MAVNKAPCKGKSFVNCLILLRLVPLQGDKLASLITQGAALGIMAISKAPCRGNSFINCQEF